jgi:hypothetical protein
MGQQIRKFVSQRKAVGIGATAYKFVIIPMLSAPVSISLITETVISEEYK